MLLSSHDYLQLRSQIGEWEELGVRDRRLEGVARYYIGEGNPEADWGFKIAERGRAAFSVGFIPDLQAARRVPSPGSWPSYEFTKQELVEVSQVTVPSNPEALQAAKAVDAVAERVVERLLRGLGANDGPPIFPFERSATEWARGTGGMRPDRMTARDLREAIERGMTQGLDGWNVAARGRRQG